MVSITPIANLPAAPSLNGSEQIPGVQAGTGVRITASQIANLATGLGTVGVPGSIPYFTEEGNISSTAALTANSLVIGGGTGAPGTTTTNASVVTAIAFATNTANGLVSINAALAAGALVVGAGSGAGPQTTDTGMGVVAAVGVTVNTAGGFVVPAAALAAGSIVLGGGSGVGPSTTTTGAGVITALGIEIGFAGGLLALNSSTYIPATPQVGFANASSAAAGNIGEVISVDVPIASAVSMTTSTDSYNIGSITLTAGDWDVTASFVTDPAGTTTTTVVQAGLSTTTGTLPTVLEQGYAQYNSSIAAGDAIALAIPRIRVNSATSTTLYLVAAATFATSTMKGYGSIMARRMR